MHPKNHHRREDIEAKTYVIINNKDDACTYLARTLEKNLKNEFASRESAIRNKLQGAVSSEQAENFISAPDKYYAAAVMC